MSEHEEIEYKFDLDEDRPLPPLDQLEGISEVDGSEPVTLDADYFDTPDRALRRHGVTLRRRTGGSDAGWHLKLPDRTDPARRIERRVALGPTHGPSTEVPVPDELLDAAAAIVRDRS